VNEFERRAPRSAVDLPAFIACGCAVFTGVATAADVGVLLAGASRGSSDAWRIASASFLWAAATGLALATLLAAGGVLVARIARAGGRSRLLAPLPLALPIAAALWFAADRLLDGPGISRKSFVAEARLAAAAAALIGPWIAGLLLLPLLRLHAARVARASGRWGLVCILLVCAGVGACALVTDRRFHPQRYAEVHLVLWLAIALTSELAAYAVVAGRSFASRRPIRAALVLFIAVAASAPFVRLLDGDPALRAAAFRDTLYLKLVLRHVQPAPPPAELRVDPALLESLRLQRAVDPGALDRALPGRRAFNVLLLSIDALRADRLGRAGYARAVTSRLDRLISSSVYFERAWSTYPATSQAFASLFSGLYPGATDVVHALTATGARPRERRQPTLAKLLSSSGRRCAAETGFSSAMMADWFPHLADGFETFNVRASRYRREQTIDAPAVAAAAIDVLDRASSRSFFLWVHFIDPHAPYVPVGPHRYGEAPRDLYDAEIHDTDVEVGNLLDALASRGRLSDTIIVALADHGEELGEHGRFYHSSALSEAQIHVPLALYVPGAAPRSVRSPVDFCDVLPTVLELLGEPIPAGLHGQSLVPAILGVETPERAWAFAELDEPELTAAARQYAVADGALKLWLDDSTGHAQLFDRDADPREENDLATERPADVARLRTLLDTHRAWARYRSAHDREAEAPGEWPAILAALEGDNVQSKLFALRTLLERGCPEAATPAVVAALRPPGLAPLRLAAAKVLVVAPGAVAGERLASLVRDDDAQVADTAAAWDERRSRSQREGWPHPEIEVLHVVAHPGGNGVTIEYRMRAAPQSPGASTHGGALRVEVVDAGARRILSAAAAIAQDAWPAGDERRGVVILPQAPQLGSASGWRLRAISR
jgi:arylsulfatase A-like enzyme